MRTPVNVEEHAPARAVTLRPTPPRQSHAHVSCACDCQRRDVNWIKRASRAMFLNSSESGSGRLAARGRGHRTGRARYAPARCESLHKPSLRSLHPLRPPRDARPEHPQPVPLTIGAIPLLRRLLSFGLRWRRSAQRGGSLSAAARCGPSLGCVRWSRRATARM